MTTKDRARDISILKALTGFLLITLLLYNQTIFVDSLGGLVMGSVISTAENPVNSNTEARERIVGVLLSSPALEIVVSGWLNKTLAPLAKHVNKIPGMQTVTKPNDIPVTSLTSDKNEREKYVNDPLVHNLVSFGIAEDFLSMVRLLRRSCMCLCSDCGALFSLRFPRCHNSLISAATTSSGRQDLCSGREGHVQGTRCESVPCSFHVR